MSVPLLRAEKVSLRFGGLQALDQVSFDLHEGEVHSLVGITGQGRPPLSGFCQESTNRRRVGFFSEQARSFGRCASPPHGMPNATG